MLLGSNTLCHACVRELQKTYGVGCVVLTDRRALTLRFLPNLNLIAVPSSLEDDLLFDILRKLERESGYRIPLLITCDTLYGAFVERNRERLESIYILRSAGEMLGLPTETK